MIQQQEFTRNNKAYTANRGDETLTVDNAAPHELTGQEVKNGPAEMLIKFDPMTGKPLSIHTTWHEIQLTNTGLPIAGMVRPMPMLTNERDMEDFTRLFGPKILTFMLNGFVRAILGHNYQPLIDATGNRILDESYDTTAEPTFNYSTHNADGTEINSASDIVA